MRSVVVPLGLAIGACSGRAADTNAGDGAALPGWDDVPSPHPPGATNPPSPVLLVTAEGACFKQWVSPMLPRELHEDRVVDACPSADPAVGDCGTAITCPPKAAELLAAKRE